MEIKAILESSSDTSLAELIVSSFQEVEKNYFLRSWKTSELDAGHFVEAVRRFIELKLFGNYTPIGSNLPNFNEQTLISYLNNQGHESYRILIPRAIYTVYAIRNKRGVGHVGQITPNKIDASVILGICKWVLAELIRLNSNHNIEKSEALIEEIIERNIEGIWEVGETKRILVEGLSLKQQILFLLYNHESLIDQDILSIIEYKNSAYFKKTLKTLHKDRIIEYTPNGMCHLSPKGSKAAEKVIHKLGHS